MGAPARFEPSGLIGSAQRALRVLEVVAAAGEAITAKAVARRAGYKLGTTYHLLNTLTYEGYLVRVGHGQGFRLGDKICALTGSPTGAPLRCHACGGAGPHHVDAAPHRQRS